MHVFIVNKDIKNKTKIILFKQHKFFNSYDITVMKVEYKENGIYYRWE